MFVTGGKADGQLHLDVNCDSKSKIGKISVFLVGIEGLIVVN